MEQPDFRTEHCEEGFVFWFRTLLNLSLTLNNFYRFCLAAELSVINCIVLSYNTKICEAWVGNRSWLIFSVYWEIKIIIRYGLQRNLMYLICIHAIQISSSVTHTFTNCWEVVVPKTGLILTSVVPGVRVNTSSFGTGVFRSNCQSSSSGFRCLSSFDRKTLTLPSRKNHSKNFETPTPIHTEFMIFLRTSEMD